VQFGTLPRSEARQVTDGCASLLEGAADTLSSVIWMEENKVALLEKLRMAAIEAEQPDDPWLAPLQRVRGMVGFDGFERVSSQILLELLVVPQRSRTAGTYRRLAKLMAELGWTAVRVRDLTRGGYKEQVRGYLRHADRERCLLQHKLKDKNHVD